jgi:SOS response regulatory protein OraA/RecX
MEKGIPQPLIRQVLGEVREELTEREAIILLIRKKVDNGAGKLDDRKKRRLAQSLMGKGFSPSLVFDILNRLKEGLPDEGE